MDFDSSASNVQKRMVVSLLLLTSMRAISSQPGQPDCKRSMLNACTGTYGLSTTHTDAVLKEMGIAEGCRWRQKACYFDILASFPHNPVQSLHAKIQSCPNKGVLKASVVKMFHG